jgi:hypothetical protein
MVLYARGTKGRHHTNASAGRVGAYARIVYGLLIQRLQPQAIQRLFEIIPKFVIL